MRLAGVIKNSLANGPGMRMVIFLQGCAHECEGCHNKHTWSISEGYEKSIDDILKDIKDEIGFINGITFSGGEPLLQSKELLKLIDSIKKLSPSLDIMLYTGFKAEEINKMNKYTKKVVLDCDYLVDGKFEINNRDNAPRYAGSANQRFLCKNDIKKIINN